MFIFYNFFLISLIIHSQILELPPPPSDSAAGDSNATSSHGKSIRYYLCNLHFNRNFLTNIIVLESIFPSNQSTSSFTAAKGAPFQEVGYVFQTPLYADKIIRHEEEKINLCSKLIPSNSDYDQVYCGQLQILVHILRQSLHLNHGWEKYHETQPSKVGCDLTIQTHHLNCIASCFPDNFFTTGEFTDIADISNCSQTNNDLGGYGLTIGSATSTSKPSAFLLDSNNIVRGIVEVKASEVAPIDSLRQAAASATNVACYLVDHGVNPLQVVVPIISSNGSLFQFGAVMVLPPCFPYFFAISRVLDLSDEDDLIQIANFILHIMTFIKQPYDNLRHSENVVRKGISRSLLFQTYF